MYTNILYFIPVLLIFSIYSPPGGSEVSLVEFFLSMIFLPLLFFILARASFRRLQSRILSIGEDASRFHSLHNGLIHKHIVYCIAIYAVWTYGFDLKWFILHVPLLSRSQLAVNVLGILPYIGLLSLLWSIAYPSYKRFLHPRIRLSQYVLSNLKFNLAILVPWFLISAVIDLLQLLPQGIGGPLLDHPMYNLLFFAAFIGLLSVFFPYLVVKLWNCPELPLGPLRKRLEEFCRKAGFEYGGILLWNLFEGKLLTAGVIGFFKPFRYILISPSLLEILSEDELEAVMAHEIGHIKHYHMIFYIFFVIGYMVFAYGFYDLFFFFLLTQDFFLNLLMMPGGASSTAISIAITVPFLIFMFLYFRFVFGFFSRHFERQSDLHAIKLQGGGGGIISSLEKIAMSTDRRKDTPSWHHYSIQERIDFIRKCENRPSLIRKHDLKVRGMVAGFFAVMALSSYFAYAINHSTFGESLGLNLVEKVLERRIEEDPANPSYHFALGNILFEKKDYRGAEAAYWKTIALRPLNAEALNNLAWLYATAEDPRFIRPKEALRLAKAAARLRPVPHILDTLAESYYVNGQYEKAVRVIEEAMKQSPENLSYYKGQLSKFRKALERSNAKMGPSAKANGIDSAGEGIVPPRPIGREIPS